MSKKPIVLKLGKDAFGDQAWGKLEKIADVITIPESTTREQFLREVKDPQNKLSQVQVITRTARSVKNTGRFDEELALALPSSVVAVCHTGAGYDQIDVEPFKKRHIQVANVPDLVSNATADTHVFLLLGALRNFGIGNRRLIEGNWPEAGPACGSPFGYDPEGKTVGILGLGRIGRCILERLKSFGFENFIYHNRHQLPSEEEHGCEYVGFEEFLKRSDIVSVNVPLNHNTHHLINAETIEKMKDGVVIVNTARGAVIDEQAMTDALRSGKIRSAGLDVFEYEPKISKELLSMSQVLGLPHMGTHSVETRKKMEELVVENAKNVILTGKVLTIVPELQNEDWPNESKPLV
ncbi:AVB_G0043850.mRNA.1.CDS.1 [Saccharomyces cerevisiae]|nr:BDC_1c_G0044470.mRNA.1.CDS.1 [Saccharomyces cerevisiae]CAI4710213.1 CPG_1a_G0044490.mRNA.1.CDS.1 [Saccharomyces cerevisiae]CAI4719696.1 AVB_G0043850.mRNA.1.CDS.1 [Saccharomyces cerevisiae]CAI7291013.1 AVB_G0043850.mRNA.1.CDS.1 [Saccharomyces cerevisiae]CAI7301178.1 BDC_1c_G0044470.mRNA.1.CDS.1 [Saccharomyces cerevisiae]